MPNVWSRRVHSNVQVLTWGIGQLNPPYERHDAGHRQVCLDTLAFRAMSPTNTVPVLRDGQGEPLWETGAILRYLAGRYGPTSFWPPQSLARAGIDKWAEWSKINVAINFIASIFWRVIRTAPAGQ